MPAPFGPINAWIVPAFDAQADAADGGKSGEFFGEILGFEDHVITHNAAFPWLSFSGCFHIPARASKGLVFHINHRL
ncbi:MAG: hypothetical protein WDN48_04615 [Pseudolabrys sp.]